MDDGPTSLSDGEALAATVEVVQGPDVGRLHIFDNNGGVIGRSGDCDLMLIDSSLSRRHAEIVYDGDTFILKNLDSTNGTRVDGRPVENPVELSRRCRITLGKRTALDFSAVDMAGLDLAYQRMEGNARLAIQREYNRRITRQATQLRQTVDDLELFTHSAVHDVRSPLQAILATAEAIRAEGAEVGSREITRYAAEIVEITQHTGKRLQKLTNYARMRLTPTHPEFLSLDDALDEALIPLAPIIRQTGAKVHRTGLPEIVGHRALLTILFQNLVENALKFRSSASPVVNISAAFDGSDWTITVEDNGVGLPAGDMDQLFEPFERSRSGKHGGGSGLGLSLVRRAVQVHGGRIWADSDQAVGAAFHFTLPNSLDQWRETRPTSDPDEVV